MNRSLLLALALVSTVVTLPAATTNSFTLAIGDTVTNGVPGPGAGVIDVAGNEDRYTFLVTNAQRVYFDNQQGAHQLYWQLFEPGGTEVFNAHLQNVEPGTYSLVTTGLYTMRVYGAGTATGSYAFKLWPVVAQSFSIAIGDTVSTNLPGSGSGLIDSPGAVDTFTFSATNGQRVYFDTQLRAWQIYWQLLDPDGAELFNNHFWDGEPGSVALTKTGTYTIRVKSSSDFTGYYSFKLWPVSTASTFSIAIGDTVSSNNPAAGAGYIETPGTTDFYTFAGTNGQQVYFDTLLRVLEIYGQLLDPDGAEIFNNHFWNAEPGTLVLPKTGNYSLRVYGSGETIGEYSFKLWSLPPPNQFTIAVGDTVSSNSPSAGAGQIEAPGLTDEYFFTNAPGQTVFFDAQGSTPSYTLRWAAYDALGNRLFDKWLNEADPGYITLPVAGSNRVVLYGSGDATGTGTFKLWDVPMPGVLGLALNDTITNNFPAAGAGNIETPGSEDLYAFTNSPGQVVFLEVISYSASLLWSVTDARGDRIFNNWLSSGDPGILVLPVAGTNIVRVYGSGQGTGPYSVRFWSVPTSENFTIAVGDTVNTNTPGGGSGRIEQPGVEDIYWFANAPGQAVYFDMLTANNALRWSLFNARGDRLFDNTLNFDPGKFTLPFGGTNRLRVYGSGASTGVYAFAITNATPDAVPPSFVDHFVISFGDTVTNGFPGPGAGNLETNGSADIYEFVGSGGDILFFEDRGSAANAVTLVLQDPNGNQLAWEWLSGFPDIGRYRLPISGTYRCVLSGNVIGTYQFTLWRVTSERFNIGFSQIVSNGVPGAGAGLSEHPGAVDVYTFAGTAGQTVFMEDFASTANQLRFFLYDPNGEYLTWEWLNGSPDIARLKLAETGDYRIEVWGQGHATGTYGFRLWDVPPTHFTLTLGETVQSNSPSVGAGFLATPGEVDTYELNVSANQLVLFEDFGSDGNQMRLDVYDPNGNFLFWEWLNGNHDLWRRQFTSSGTHRLVVYGNGQAVGAYSFRVRAMPPDQFFNLSLDTIVTNGVPAAGAGNLEQPGGQDTYFFTAAPGQIVYFEDFGAQTPINWIVYDAGGATIFNDRLDGGDPGRRQLTRGGACMVVVYPAGASTNYVGTYSFRIRSVPADQFFQIAIGDTVTNTVPTAGAGNLEAAGAYDIYTFTAPAGQLIYFEDLGGQTAINWIIYDETGATVFNDRLDTSDPGRRHLVRGGAYTIYVYPAGASVSYLGTYSFRLQAMPPDQQFNITLGDVVENGRPSPGAGNLETPGTYDIYTFAAAPGQVVYFEDRSADVCCLNWDVYDANGSRIVNDRLDDVDPGTRTLTLGGLYTIYVYPAGASVSYVGAYSFRVWAAPPYITAQPLSQRGLAGQTQVLSVTASSPFRPLAYQWFFNGTNLPSATNSILTLSNTAPAQAGDYFVIVTNIYGATTSQVATLTLDSSELFVTAFTPRGPTPAGVSSLRVQFNEAINLATFTPADVVLRSPTGVVSSAGFTILPVDAQTFDVLIPAQTASGTYTIEIGPGITNLSGQPMTGGVFTPVYAAVFETGVGAEWSRFDSISNSVTTAFLGNFASEFVTLTLSGLPPHDRLRLKWDLLVLDSWDGENGGPDTWGFNIADTLEPAFEYSFNNYPATNQPQTFPGYPTIGISNFAANIYADSIYRDLQRDYAHTNSALTVSFYGKNLQVPSDESWGLDNVRVLTTTPSNGLFTATFTIDATPPTVTGFTPAGTSLVPVDHADLAFDQDIQPGTFTTNDVQIIGPLGSITPISLMRLSNATYRVTFASQRLNSAYTVVIGPNILDLAGNAMSAPATNSFNILTPPTIATQPASQTVVRNNNVTFSVVANSTPPTSYQWDYNGAPIANATNSTLALFNVQPTNSGAYRATVTDAGGPTTSSAATLTVLQNYGPFIAEAQAARPTVPAVSGNGVFIELYNGIGGGGVPTPALISNVAPSGTTLSPVIDFPHPGASIGVGSSFNNFFQDTTTPPDAVLGLAAANFVLRHTFFLAVRHANDRHPETPEIDISLGVGSDDGFYLLVGTNFIGQASDRGFSYSWMDVSFENEGLYPVTMLFAANAVGASGLEMGWQVGTNAAQIIPQSALYISPDLGDWLITFEEFPVNTILSNQFAPTGVVFSTISGQLQITTNFPANFVPVSPRSVFADPRTNPAELGEVELTFVDPATGVPATTDFLNFFVIDAETNGATVLAYNWLNQLVFSNAYHGGGAAQELVTINRRGVARVRVTLGQGSDTAAIDNLALTAPLSRADLAVEILDVPASTQAGQLVPVIWRVTNRGLSATTAPWAETLSVSDDAMLGNDLALGIFTVTNTLPAGASLTRTQNVAVPFSGPAGNVYFVVSASSSEPAGEYDYANNTAIASNATTIPLVLALDIPNHQFPENAAPGSVLGNVSRNGSRVAALTVTLGSSDTNAATVPATIQIPSGQSSATFAITPVPDGVPTLDKPVTIFASAGGYASANSNVVVLNVDQPGLGLSILNSTLLEGQSSSATVARTGSTNEPLLVVLASSSAGQLNVPASVTIPAGAVGVMFFVTAAQDLNLEPNLTYTITASASGFTPASAGVTVLDDDIPTAALTLSRTNVSEGDGPNAASATLYLPAASTLPVTFALASSNPAKLQVPPSVTIPGGGNSVVFSIAAIDNALVDGSADVTITATLLSTVGGVPLPPALTVFVRVEDNDGPTLTLALARHLVAEGVTNATTATVTRNVVTNALLVVTLTSSDIGEAVTPPSVTIPANQASANFSINSLNDGVTDGNKSVTITANAADFTSGSDTLVVSDVNLADLVISSLSAPTNALTETFFSLTYRESNLGFAAATGAWSQVLFLSRDQMLDKNDTVLGQFTFTGTMNPGLFFERTVTFRLPREVGNYWVIAQSDPSNAVVEVLEDNNVTVAALPIALSAAYSATVHTDFTQGLAGTPVLMEGTATRVGGAPAAFELVNIYVKVRETVRVLGALADEYGHFSATFRPLLGEAGHYTIGAAHPGQTDAPVQDSFDLLGMKFDPANVSHVLPAQTTLTNIVTLTNRSEIALTGLTTTVLDAPAGVTVSAAVPGSLAGGAGTPVPYTITSTANASSAGTVRLRVNSAEGTHTDLLIDLRVEARVPQLVAVPGSLSAGMLRGAQTIVSFTVRNDGGEASGPLEVLLPAADWLHLATVSPLPSLVPGASNLVTLLLTPAADLPLTDYHGSLVLSGAGTSLSVPFSFRALSDGLGTVRVEAVDEYTYYAEGAPRVTNATVRLKDPATGDVLTNGLTDAQGSCVLTNVREGYYTLEVTATNHNDFRGTILVSAGATNESQAFLPRQTVQYIWTVVPTEIEDRTRITIETVFETVVPIPVVTVSPNLIDLNEIQQEVSQIDLVITNHGLVAAQNIRINFGSNEEWQFTPLVTELGDLPARSSFTVPMTIRHLTGGAASGPSAKARAAASNSNGGGCGIAANILWELICGTNRNTYAVPVAIPGNCGGGAGAVYACCGGGGGAIYPVSFASSGLNLCDPCGQEIAEALLDCIIGFLPIPDVIGCAQGAYECVTEPSVLGCAGAIVTCLAAAGKEIPGLGQIISALDCADGLLSACGGPGLGGALGLGGGGPSAGPRRLSAENGGSPVLNYPGMEVVIEHARRVDTYRAVFASLLGSDPAWYHANQGTNFGVWLEQFATTITTNSDAGQHVSATEQAALLTGTFPDGVAQSNLVAFIERWNRTVDYDALGIHEASQVPGGQSTDFITRSAYSNAIVKMNQAIALDQAQGYADALVGFKAATDRLRQILTSSANSGGVCARVKLRLNQDLVLTRDAFNATLEIINNSGTSLNGLSVDLLVKNEAGDVTTSFFAIRPPELTGLSDVSGGGVVVSGTSGKASWILIPTDDAAPAVQTAYFVSGTLRYVQDGVTVTVPLAPVRITVFPNPSLALTYFHERDVRSDDPFTPQIEPSIPYSLAVMVKNNGAGQAKNVRITSGKPEIIENEKGLLIGFDIIATEVAGQGLTPSLTADFGNIAPGGIGLARWLFKSTLQGQFISYSATFENLSDLGSDKLSLVDSVNIHELIHIVRAGGSFEDGLPDFLVNDFNDFDALPDTLYLSDGSIAPVTALTNVTANGLVTPGNLTVTLNTPTQAGWLYLRANDPGQGQYRLVRVLRSDSTELRLGDNVWTTDRTFIAGGARPVYENKLHLFDRDSTGQYTLEYAPLAATDVTAPVSAIAPLPTNSYAQIPLTWSGQDEVGGSGLAFFDVFVSVDGGAFTRWLNHTPTAGVVYQGTLGHSYAFYTVALDNAGNAESAPLTPDAQTVVGRTNSPPSFASGAALTINEGVIAVLDVPANDPDLPEQTLTYALSANAPAGASIHSGTGRIIWLTGEGNGPSTNNFSVIVTDNGTPALSATTSVSIAVHEVNNAPTLAPIRNYVINEGFELIVTNVTGDSDLPANTLRFTLGAGAPSGAAIDATNGLFRWRPTETQGPSTNPVAVIVTDNGTPALGTTQWFNVVVRDVLSDCMVTVGSTNVLAGESNAVSIGLSSGLDLASIHLLVETRESHLGNFSLHPVAAEVVGSLLAPAGSNQLDLTFTLDPLLAAGGTRVLAQLGFVAVSNQPSAIVPLRPLALTVTRATGTNVVNRRADAGRVIVVNREPVLVGDEMRHSRLRLYGRPGANYMLWFNTNLIFSPWIELGPVNMVERSALFPGLLLDGPRRFFRAEER